MIWFIILFTAFSMIESIFILDFCIWFEYHVMGIKVITKTNAFNIYVSCVILLTIVQFTIFSIYIERRKNGWSSNKKSDW